MKYIQLFIFSFCTFIYCFGQEQPVAPEKEREPTEVNQEKINNSDLLVTPSDAATIERPVYKKVEVMPRFPGCEDIQGDDRTKERCAKEKMLQYIYRELVYPSEARENGVEGMAVIQFVVEADGSLNEINIVRDPGAGCGQAAFDVVAGMTKNVGNWTPGLQDGKPISVLYTLPVKFKLQSSGSNKFKRKKRKRGN